MKLKSFVIWTVMFLALLLSAVLTLTGVLEQVDLSNTDTYHVISGVRHQPKSTVIVTLDSESLEFYPNTPLVFWGPHFAKAIQRLKEAGAAAIALDIYFAITPEQWFRTLDEPGALPSKIADYDQIFDQALSEGGIILATNPVLEKNNFPVPLPAAEYLAALPTHLEAVGLTILHRDSDAKIRRMVLAYEGLPTKPKDGINQATPSGYKIPDGYQTPNPWWTFAALALKEGFGAKNLAAFRGQSIFSPKLINYCGPPGTIPRVSLAALFREQGLTAEEKALIAGRIVFIGATYENFGDHHPTPYSRNFMWFGHRDMNGVEIHANIAETILNPHRIQYLPPIVTIFLWGAIMVLAAISCELHIKTMAVYIMKATSVLILWPIGLVCFRHGYLLPQAGCFIAIISFFLTIATLRTIGAHDRTIRIIGQVAYDALYHERRDRRKTDNITNS